MIPAKNKLAVSSAWLALTIAVILAVVYLRKTDTTPTMRSPGDTGRGGGAQRIPSGKESTRAVSSPAKAEKSRLVYYKNRWMNLLEAGPASVEQIEALMSETFDSLGCTRDLVDFMQFYIVSIAKRIGYPSKMQNKPGGFLSTDRFLCDRFLLPILMREGKATVLSDLEKIATSDVFDESVAVFLSNALWTAAELGGGKFASGEIVERLRGVHSALSDRVACTYILRKGEDPARAAESMNEVLEYYFQNKTSNVKSQLITLSSSYKTPEAYKAAFEVLQENGAKLLDEKNFRLIEFAIFSEWSGKDPGAVTSIALSRNSMEILGVCAGKVFDSINESDQEPARLFHDWVQALPSHFDRDVLVREIVKRSSSYCLMHDYEELRRYYSDPDEFAKLAREMERKKKLPEGGG